MKNGHIKRITDSDIQSSVLEIMGTNVSTNYIICPRDAKQTLGIKLPFLVMILKNLNKYFTFEVQVLDDKNVRRRFRASNYQSTTRVKPFICTMPMRLDDGWNQIQFNLSDFTRRAYGTNYIETLRVQIHANCRIRRIYFSDRLYSEDELPPEFKLFLPIVKSNTATTESDAFPIDDRNTSSTQLLGTSETNFATTASTEIDENVDESNDDDATSDLPKADVANTVENSLEFPTVLKSGEGSNECKPEEACCEEKGREETTIAALKAMSM